MYVFFLNINGQKQQSKSTLNTLTFLSFNIKDTVGLSQNHFCLIVKDTEKNKFWSVAITHTLAVQSVYVDSLIHYG